MPSAANVGGLSGVVAITLIVGAVRLYKVHASRKEASKKREPSLGRHHASLSAASLFFLIATRPIPFAVVDVRDKRDENFAPLPLQLGEALEPSGHLANALQPPATWTLYVHSSQTKYASYDDLLVFVGNTDKQMLDGARHAAQLGFQRTAALSGGAETLQISHEHKFPDTIGRDALAALLGQIDGLPVKQAVVLDVRRHDERALYGSIPGTVHLPLHQLPAAMHMVSEEWLKSFTIPRPEVDDWIVMHSRGHNRAQWAAQIAKDAGFTHCLVYSEGLSGWRLHSEVKMYAHFDVGDAPPEPQAADIEVADPSEAFSQLMRLGLLHDNSENSDYFSHQRPFS